MPAGWAAAIGAAGSVVGGMLQSNAVSSGQQQAQAFQQQARQMAGANYTHDQANYQPYITTGQNALSGMADLSGLNGQAGYDNALSSFRSSPGYQYQLSQGLQSVDHGAAAKGMLRSGETLRAEQTLGANLADSDFSNYYNKLSGLAGMGLQGAGLGNQSTSTYDSVLSGSANNSSQTAASAAGQQASIYGNIASGVTGAANKYAQNSLFQTAMEGQRAANTVRSGGLY